MSVITLPLASSSAHVPSQSVSMTMISFEQPARRMAIENDNSNGVVNIMRNMGNTDDYWVREDGVKMLGDYVMVAADLSIHPRGVIVETSLGQGLVCDTGDFTEDIYDVATDW